MQLICWKAPCCWWLCITILLIDWKSLDYRLRITMMLLGGGEQCCQISWKSSHIWWDKNRLLLIGKEPVHCWWANICPANGQTFALPTKKSDSPRSAMLLICIIGWRSMYFRSVLNQHATDCLRLYMGLIDWVSLCCWYVENHYAVDTLRITMLLIYWESLCCWSRYHHGVDPGLQSSPCSEDSITMMILEGLTIYLYFTY